MSLPKFHTAKVYNGDNINRWLRRIEKDFQDGGYPQLPPNMFLLAIDLLSSGRLEQYIDSCQEIQDALTAAEEGKASIATMERVKHLIITKLSPVSNTMPKLPLPNGNSERDKTKERLFDAEYEAERLRRVAEGKVVDGTFFQAPPTGSLEARFRSLQNIRPPQTALPNETPQKTLPNETPNRYLAAQASSNAFVPQVRQAVPDSTSVVSKDMEEKKATQRKIASLEQELAAATIRLEDTEKYWGEKLITAINDHTKAEKHWKKELATAAAKYDALTRQFELLQPKHDDMFERDKKLDPKPAKLLPPP